MDHTFLDDKQQNKIDEYKYWQNRQRIILLLM
jgi:hypothetical protein